MLRRPICSSVPRESIRPQVSAPFFVVPIRRLLGGDLKPFIPGSEAALDDYFKQWADVRSVTWGAEDRAATKFQSALFTAQYSADSSEWRSAERLRSRHELLVGHEAEDPPRIFEGLNGLRRCGDDKSVEAAVRRIWRVRPLEPLADAVEVAAKSTWTRTAALPSLVLVRCAADLLSEDVNLQVVKELLGILGADYAELRGAMPPTVCGRVSRSPHSYCLRWSDSECRRSRGCSCIPARERQGETFTTPAKPSSLTFHTPLTPPSCRQAALPDCLKPAEAGQACTASLQSWAASAV